MVKVLIMAALACGVACAGSAPPPAASPGAETSAERTPARDPVAVVDSLRNSFTATDVEFMTGMIAHHAQALVMAVRDESGAWTLEFLQRMATDINFWAAIRNTLLLILAMVPLQMALALIMALLLNSGLRGASFWLYAWAIPLAISDLAAGIVWLSIFTDRG